MFAKLAKWTMLLSYLSAMMVSIVAHDVFHHHEHENEHSDTEACLTQNSSEKSSGQAHSHKGHHHHHHHGHHSHGDHSHSSKADGCEKVAKNDEAKSTETVPHSHSHHGHNDCPVCEFLSLQCIEATIAEVESASELIMLASQNALCYHEAFSPYQPPSRAPPAC